MDGVDKTMDFILLKWEREGDAWDVSPLGSSYGFVPIDSLRGRVHMVDKWKTVGASGERERRRG